MENDISNPAGTGQEQVPAGDTATPEAQPAKADALVPSHRLREETEKRKEAEAKLAETEANSQQEKAQVELQYAREMYGESVDDQQVQDFKASHPDLSYKQVFGALGIEVPPLHAGHSPTPGRSAGTMSGANGATEYKVSEVQDLSESNPKEYRRIMDGYANKEIKIIAG